MTRAPMRTVDSDPSALASIYLLLDSQDHSDELESRFASFGCRCVSVVSFEELNVLLFNDNAAVLIASFELNGQCVLEFCREQSHLLSEVPVAFYIDDPATGFEQSLEAIRLGAVDVLTSPISFDKLEELSKLAMQRRHSISSRTLKDNSFRPRADRDGPKRNDSHLIAESVEAEHLAPKSPAATTGNQVNPSNRNACCAQAAARVQSELQKVKELESWILGSSPAMQSVRSIIAEVAETKANVMIYGASGTGKELVATAVHKLSNRCNGRFEPVNMTEIPHDLAESLLFGHEKGAFTGADYRQIGVCEAADGGTLFLDEIGEMALATQPKLLRFLQEGTVRRIGSQTNKKVDVRVITATNRSPETIVKEGRLREDLFFRLHVVPIYIPPLHDRPEDIEQLAMLFLNRYVEAYNRSVEGFTREALDIFRLHDWPGNVRQLENVVERLVVFAKGRLIDVPDIPAEIHAASMFGEPTKNGSASEPRSVLFNTVPYKVDGKVSEAANAVASMSAIQRTERAAIIEALQRCDGHVIDAAHLLGLGQATVYRKIKQYHIPHQRRRRRRSPK